MFFHANKATCYKPGVFRILFCLWNGNVDCNKIHLFLSKLYLFVNYFSLNCPNGNSPSFINNNVIRSLFTEVMILLIIVYLQNKEGGNLFSKSFVNSAASFRILCGNSGSLNDMRFLFCKNKLLLGIPQQIPHFIYLGWSNLCNYLQNSKPLSI